MVDTWDRLFLLKVLCPNVRRVHFKEENYTVSLWDESAKLICGDIYSDFKTVMILNQCKNMIT